MRKLLELPFLRDLEKGLDRRDHVIQAIIGPRQVGKTTSVLDFIERRFSGKALYVSADQVFNSDVNWLVSTWKQAESEKKALFIDEIQKVEGWSEGLKKLWDDAKRRKRLFPCVILGSSSLEIQKGISDSLTGRHRLIRAFHWNYEESKKGYGLTFDEYLKFGGYPGSYAYRDDLKEWSGYVKNSIIGTVIEKDILSQRAVRSPSLFRQAFDILVSLPAQEISFTKLLGHLQDKGNVELVKHYLHLYEGAFLILGLNKFSDSIIRTRLSSPKIVPMAPALYYLTIQSNFSSEERGRAFEALVGAQLARTQEDLYYWRDRNDEVDYVLRRGKSVWGIEVKSGRRRRTAGIQAFSKRFPKAVIVVITPENYPQFEKDPLKFLEEA